MSPRRRKRASSGHPRERVRDIHESAPAEAGSRHWLVARNGRARRPVGLRPTPLTRDGAAIVQVVEAPACLMDVPNSPAVHGQASPPAEHEEGGHHEAEENVHVAAGCGVAPTSLRVAGWDQPGSLISFPFAASAAGSPALERTIVAGFSMPSGVAHPDDRGCAVCLSLEPENGDWDLDPRCRNRS